MNGCMVMDVALQKRIERRIYWTGENDAKNWSIDRSIAMFTQQFSSKKINFCKYLNTLNFSFMKK